MAVKKKTEIEIPEAPVQVETADQDMGVRRVLKEYIGGGVYAACGNCGCRLVNVEERVKCRYCWNCGRKVLWK